MPSVFVMRRPAASSGGPISDTFDRTNSSTTVNPASDGGTWTMYDLQHAPTDPLLFLPTHGIISNETYVVTASGVQTGAYRDLGSVACDVSLTFSTTSYYRGCIHFAVDPTTGIGYSVEPWRSSIAVERFSGFGTTGATLGSPTGDPPTGTVVRVTYDGIDTIKIYWAGVLQQTIVDTSPIVGAGNTWVGYGASQAYSSTGETFNDFTAT